jgi:hypothetical protein
MSGRADDGAPANVRQWSAAERAAFARHEEAQRRREAQGMSWTQKLDALGSMRELAWALRPQRAQR